MELLKNSISLEYPLNLQHIMRCDALLKEKAGKLTKDECITQIRAALSSTIPYETALQAKNGYLTNTEIECIYNIATRTSLNYLSPDFDLLISMCQSYETADGIASHISIYELIMTTVASILGNMGNYEQSDAISQKIIYASLNCRRMTMIHKNLYNFVWNNQKRQELGIPFSSDYSQKKGLKMCIVFSHMTKNTAYEKRYLEQFSSLD